MPDFIVTTSFDELFDGTDLASETADGTGLSLREALGLADATPAETSTITFDHSVLTSGVVYADLGALYVGGNAPVAIDGGVGMVLQSSSLGGGASRVLTIAPDALVSLRALTITGGDDGGPGGGVLVDGGAVVTMTDVSLTDNTSGSFGGGLYVAVGANVVADGLRVAGNLSGAAGGGIAVAAGGGFLAAERNLTVTDNVASSYGGGIFIAGDATIDGAEIGRNTALWGGGIELDGVALTLTNATVHGNSATSGRGGGIDAYSGAITITSSTITGNAANFDGGGIYISTSAQSGSQIDNTIIAGNAAVIGADMSGAAVSAGAVFGVGNLLGEAAEDTGGGPIAIDPAAAIVLAGSGKTAADVFAAIDGATGGGLVQDNGGFVGTAALASDAANPALGGADAATVAPVDARGVARDLATADIGAFEAALAAETPSLVVTTFDDVTDAYDGLTSLREAVGYVNDGLLAGSITFASVGTALLTQGELLITADMAITGEATIDGGGASRLLHVLGAAVSLDGLTLTGGNAVDGLGGGAALVEAGSDVSIFNSYVNDNASGTDGGGVMVMAGGTLWSGSTYFASNASAGDGAGVAVAAGGALLFGSDLLFDHNVASGGGGGMMVSGFASLVNATFTGNSAFDGGGLSVAAGGSASLNGGLFAANSAGGEGGGAQVASGGALEIVGGAFDYNIAFGGAGGGIVSDGDLTIASGSFTGNDAHGAGGGIASLGGALLATDTDILGNSAGGMGGGLYVGGSAEIERVRIDGNTGAGGGGAAVGASGVLLGRDVALTGNLTAQDGGGLLAFGTAQLANADIGGNTAYTGGGIYAAGAAVTLSNATIHDNEASLWGGGIRGHYGVIDISSSTITGNAATVGLPGDPASGGGIMMTSTAAGLTITNTIIAGNTATEGPDLTAVDAPVALGGVILGEEAAQWYGGALALPADKALVLASAGLSAADVFAAVGGAGGGVAAANGGFGDTVALALTMANPAIGAAAALPGVTLDPGDLDGDGVTAEAVPFDARGVARPATGADIGAYEAPATETPSLRVTTLEDIVNDSDGLTSLREAVAYANAGALSGYITFATAGTAVLDHGALAISGVVSIYGDVDYDGVADVTVDAQGLSRAIEVGGTADLAFLRLTGGASAGDGGAADVAAGGSLYINRVSVTDSVAGGDGGGIHVASGGALTAFYSRIDGNVAAGRGGGMAVEGRVSGATLEIGRNAAQDGGGLFVGSGSGRIDNATIHGNTAATGGGGVTVDDSELSINASTITGNTVTDGAGVGGGVRYVTPFAGGALLNTIVVGNDATNGADISLGGATHPTFNGNLLGRAATLADGSAVSLTADQATVLAPLGLDASDVFAALDPATGGGLVSDNGGLVGTAALAASPLNPAVDTVTAPILDRFDLDLDGDYAEPLPVDARGEARGAIHDIGAYELTTPLDAPSLVVTSADDVTDYTDGVTTLREAIAWVESGALTGTITFAQVPGANFQGVGGVRLGGEELVISGDVSIDGGGGTYNIFVTGGNVSRVARIADGGSLTVSNINLTSGKTSGDGGAVLVEAGGAFTLESAVVSNSTADGDGGGVFVAAGATFAGRDARINSSNALAVGGEGGGLAVEGVATLVNSLLLYNNAAQGGGVSVQGGALTASNLTVAGNLAFSSGGGISVVGGGSAVVDHATVTDNTLTIPNSLGGGIAVVESDLTITNSVVVGNVGVAGNAVVVNWVDIATTSSAVTAGRDVLVGVAVVDAVSGAPTDDPGVNARVLADEGLVAADIFALAGVYGGGGVADNGGAWATVALAEVAGNVALGSAIAAPDTLDADGDGNAAEALTVDARGVARAAVGGDLGALEVTTTYDGPPSLVVTTTSDAINDSDGETSLREAVAYLQSGALSGTITFAGQAFAGGATIALTGGALALSGVIAIDGDVNGDGVADVTIDAGGASRVIDVASFADVRLSHLIVTGGDAGAENGGGIRLAEAATLDLDAVTVANNQAIRGGGILADYVSVLTARDLVVTGNAAAKGGGGIQNRGGDVTIVNAEISDNHVAGATGSGGGITANFFGDTTLTNVTLHGNTAYVGGGMSLTQSTATLDHVTIAGNAGDFAGGMLVSGDLAITNSIIAGNTSSGALNANPDLVVDDYSGDVTGASGVYIGSTAYYSDLYTEFTEPGITEVSATTLFAAFDGAGLPVLADNGGPVKTVALSPYAGNPALDSSLPLFGAGVDADGDGTPDFILTTDARGAPRDWMSDAGAYEAPGVTAKSLVVDTRADVVDATDGVTSLREAIGWVQDGSLSGTITFASGAGDAFQYGGTIALNGSELLIDGAVSIDGDIYGDGTADVTLDAGGLSRVMRIVAGEVDLTGLVIMRGRVDGADGAGILVESGALTLDSAVVAYNVAGAFGDHGGGISVNYGATLTARDVAIYYNNSSGNGGGLSVYGEASLVNAEVSGNYADSGGGGIFVGADGALQAGSLSMANATVHGNNGFFGGGGIHLDRYTTATLDHMTITDNISQDNAGGGMRAEGDSVTVTNSIIAGNFSGNYVYADLEHDVADTGASLHFSDVLLGGEAWELLPWGYAVPIPLAGTTTLTGLGLRVGDVFAVNGASVPVLTDNGGFARTVALVETAGNPALGAATAGLDPLDADGDGVTAEALPTDARGVARGAFADLGAYEAPKLDGTPNVVTTTADVVDENDGVVSLREAVAYANAQDGPAYIYFARALTGSGTTFTLTEGALEITGDVTIHGDVDGDLVGDVVIDANHASRALVVAEGGRGVLNAVTLTGGVATTGFGGGALVEGGAALEMRDSVVTGNAAAAGGGGIHVAAGGSLIGERMAITDNHAAGGNGGGLLSRGATTFYGVEFGGNSANSGAGAMIDGGAATILNATIHGNAAASFGGGVAVLGDGVATILGATVTGNSAAGFAGGGVLLGGSGEASVLSASIIAGNGAPRGADVALMGGAWSVGDTLLGTAALTDGRAGHAVNPAAGVRVLADDGIGIDAVFETLDGSGTAGLATDTGGVGKVVALAAAFDNPAIDAGYAFSFEDALGAPRAVAFLDPFGADAADLGAVEVVRQALPALAGLLPSGAPVIGDLSGGAADLSGGAADFDGAAFANLGADDRLLFAGATSAAQFAYDGTFLTYDADGDGAAEATTWLSLEPGSPPAEIAYDVAAGGVTVSATAPPPPGKAIGEVLQITVGTDWQSISFENTYNNAVVFALAPSLNEVESAATRFRNIDANGGEIKLQETKVIIDPATGLQVPNTSGHVDETVTLLVLERGKHTLEDGTVIRVGEINTSKLYVKGFETIAFSAGMTSTPSIFSQVQTYNGNDFIISRQRNPGTTGFELTMQEEQADNINHATETVGWLAVEHGSGSLSTMDFQVGSSAQNVNGKLTNVSFTSAFETAPLVVAALASYNGTDTSSPRIGSVTTTKFTAMALEDQSFDLETQHGFEIVDWMAFSNAGIIYDNSLSAPAALTAPALAAAVAGPEEPGPAALVARTGMASVSSETVTVSFGATFANPVVIASLTSAYDVGAAIARISNVTATGFDVAVQETGDQDGVHGAEDISWIVVEAGTWVLADGTMIEAGVTDLASTTKQGFAAISFAAGFEADPAVLSQTQTANDGAFVKTRMDGVDAAGFAVALEEEEASSWGAHGAETVGWIAMDIGAAMDADGFVFEAGTLRARDTGAVAAFDAAMADAGVVAGVASYAGPDTVAARLGALTADGFEAHLEEDLSLNAEISHRAEDIAWLAFDGATDIWGDALA